MASSEPPFMHEQRSEMAKLEAAGLELLGPCPPHLGEASIDIPLPDNQSNATKVVWPRLSDELPIRCPLVIYFHGGGLSTCSPDLVLAPARGFATVLSCVVACPTINQLPTHPFPEPVRAAWEACAWMSEVRNLNEGVLKNSGVSVDPGRGLVVGGLSSGGSVAAVIGSIPDAISAGLEGFAGLTPLRNPITGIFSGLPFLVSEPMLPAEYRGIFKSRETAVDNKAILDAMRHDLEARLDVHSPWFSPINLEFSHGRTFQEHPSKVFVYGGEHDLFRDDAIIYGKWFSESAGVQARTTILKGEGHTAWVSPPWPGSHSRMIKEATLDGMAWLLDMEWDKSLEDLPF
ncbi:alpha/beta-hydrolase [Aspergillus steynii IBT 23096]|uniref:Alpha/beta-hydrolase n=1 Tax=Aspergillus steynii IBT 23096 TaxID=1392250 RepID=A0A2I2GPT7_9EURO|nr:alpha/beta-hydrolase [Aspergillus steynii IBT 23096]PLB54891.1 alpha/beta-hydrolase [Aspergillus steynii IBT 23096]